MTVATVFSTTALVGYFVLMVLTLGRNWHSSIHRSFVFYLGDEKTFCNTVEVLSSASRRGIAPIKMALAGVGSPRKVYFCEESIVKRASLIAEKTGIRNAV